MATLSYEDDILDIEYLPINARDLCTKVTLVIAGRPSGSPPDKATAIEENIEIGGDHNSSREYLTYYPVPIVYTTQHAQHSIYGAHKVFELPAGVLPFMEPTYDNMDDPVRAFVKTNTSVGVPEVRDGDPETSYILTWNVPAGGGWGMPDFQDYLVYRFLHNDHLIRDRMVGWRLMYYYVRDGNYADGDEATMNAVEAVVWASREEGGVAIKHQTLLRWATPPTEVEEAAVEDMWATVHRDARGVEDGEEVYDLRLRLAFRHGADASRAKTGTFEVIHFYPLILDSNYLGWLARKHFRLPSSAPARLRVKGAIPWAEEHTIIDLPDEDEDTMKVRVAKHTYENGITIIDLEEPGPPPGVAIELLEAEKLRHQRETEERRRALYPVRMMGR